MSVQAQVGQAPLRIQTPAKSRRRITVIAILALLLIIAALAGIKILQIVTMVKAGKSFVPPPESVATAKSELANWRASRTATGSMVAVHAVTLGAESGGTVREILFDSGALVKKGTVLVKLDTSTEQAQLQSAHADSALAKANLQRVRSLRQSGANTPADLDSSEARAKQTEAAVEILLTTIAKKTIRAPFDGRVNIRQVELGQIISPGTPITSLHSVSPMYAEFSLPQQALAEVKVGQKIQMTVDIFPGSKWEGEVSVINPEVEVATRNVRIRATVENPDARLAPGMFVNVEALSSDDHQVVIIPATSVIYAPYGDSVFVVEEKKKPDGKIALTARQRFVRLGARRGDFVAVVSGISPGESMISSGAFKVRNGAEVTVNNQLAPPAQLSPKPAD